MLLLLLLMVKLIEFHLQGRELCSQLTSLLLPMDAKLLYLIQLLRREKASERHPKYCRHISNFGFISTEL
jgi:hypothetical protein